MLLVLSHGQATVESGFSVNEDMLVENLKEHSLIAQRIVYDSIKQVGGALGVDIDKDMMLKFRSANLAYKHYLDQQKKINKEKVFVFVYFTQK